MQILHPGVFLPFLFSVALAISTPFCAVPPLEITDYVGEFWIQAVYLNPVPGLRNTLTYSPLHVVQLFDPRYDAQLNYGDYSAPDSHREFGADGPAFYDRLVVASNVDSTDLFRLQGTKLEKNLQAAVLWSEELLPDETGFTGSLVNGFIPVGFNFISEAVPAPPTLKFRIVKVCTSDKNTELQL